MKHCILLALLAPVLPAAAIERGEAAGGREEGGTGATLTCDFGRYFARVAHDPHVNFTPERMLRMAFGGRF